MSMIPGEGGSAASSAPVIAPYRQSSQAPDDPMQFGGVSRPQTVQAVMADAGGS